ncbi:MAG: hypothetical protein ABI395_07285 [Sphingobium sp.]
MKPVYAALLLMTMPLTGCFGKNKDAPTGQVVATIDGDEITAAELTMEMGGVSSTDPATMKRLKSMALQNILNRHILAAQAKKVGVDGTPAAEMAKRKARQIAVIELLQEKMRAGVPAASKEEAQQYVNEHPGSFAQRRIFVVDQIILGAVPADIMKALEPLDTMADVQALLNKRHIASSKTVGVIDALSIDPDAVEKIVSLPPSAVFINRDGGPIRINSIRETQVEPISNDAAVRIAQEKLQNRRVGAQVKSQIDSLLQDGMKNVKLNAEFTSSPIAKGATAPAS